MKIIYTKSFKTQAQRLLKLNPRLKPKVEMILEEILQNPFSEALYNEPVSILQFSGALFATRITSHVKIIWKDITNEESGNNSILLLTITGYDKIHS